MSNEAGDFLESSVRRTFRDFAGLTVENWEKNTKQELPFSNVFIIDSFRPEEISLQFYFSLEGKRLLVEKILKENWENIKSHYIDDCLLEVVNIVGGNFFAAYFSGSPYDLGLPLMTFDDRGLSKGDRYFFNSEGILFGITLSKE